MNVFINSILLMSLLFLNGCSGQGGGAGHWFHIIFIIIPAGIAFHLINSKIEDLRDTISRQDDRITNLSNKLDKDKKSSK